MRTAIRAAGLRATARRVAVLAILSKAAEPMSHGEIAARLTRVPNARSTVYRNLVALAKAGLVHRSSVDGVWRFARAPDAQHARAHPHFACDRCGRIACLVATTVTIDREAVPLAVRLGQIEIVIRGVCDACAG